jgi:GNAT superfamily N-acetyltransferase
MAKEPRLQVEPVTPKRWRDLETLFGERGACAGCWCMWWRIKRSVWNQQKGEGNRKALRKIVETGEVPGLLAYRNGEPVGWISMQSREAFPVLENSRILKRVDNQPVWSIVCFFIAKPHRRKGLSVQLLKSAVRYARQTGATVVEGYPHDVKASTPDVFIHTGLVSAFRKAGFEEVARRSAGRPIMRFLVRAR